MQAVGMITIIAFRSHKIDITVDTHVRINQQYAHILKFNMQVTYFKIYPFLFTMNESKKQNET